MKPPFSKILIANRGEIAVRIIRACRELGIRTVAIYSEADREALHVLMADEARLIGPAPARESYLSVERIVEAVQASGAEAVHPGYGFLSENAAFADACQTAGLIFIGPPPAAIRAMGDKTEARRIAAASGVPTIPGTSEPVESDEEAARMAQEIGFPVMVKAVKGGGGKGMRLVRDPTGLPLALRLARSEAKAAFGDPAIYFEKYLEEPRHIEIQLLADAHGKIVHLGERECSIQRRHQKLIEESPSPFLDEPLRRAMGEAACRVASAAGYINAGTVEFLVDQRRGFYFLEMNTRLQVEHPVTEMVTGIDMVKEQLRIAAGEKLSYDQESICRLGWAIECRIYAEDPETNFLPSPGRVTRLKVPSGPWIRDDSGVYEGYEVPLYYDPLISKLVVWGRDREEAIQRMTRALVEYEIGGIKTTLPFHRRVMRHPDFLAGRIHTNFVETRLSKAEEGQGRSGQRIAVIAAALHAYRQAQRPAPPPTPPSSSWRFSFRPGQEEPR